MIKISLILLDPLLVQTGINGDWAKRSLHLVGKTLYRKLLGIQYPLLKRVTKGAYGKLGLQDIPPGRIKLNNYVLVDTTKPINLHPV